MTFHLDPSRLLAVRDSHFTCILQAIQPDFLLNLTFDSRAIPGTQMVAQ